MNPEVLEAFRFAAQADAPNTQRLSGGLEDFLAWCRNRNGCPLPVSPDDLAIAPPRRPPAARPASGARCPGCSGSGPSPGGGRRGCGRRGPGGRPPPPRPAAAPLGAPLPLAQIRERESQVVLGHGPLLGIRNFGKLCDSHDRPPGRRRAVGPDGAVLRVLGAWSHDRLGCAEASRLLVHREEPLLPGQPRPGAGLQDRVPAELPVRAAVAVPHPSGPAEGRATARVGP